MPSKTELQIARECAVRLAGMIVSANGCPSIKFCQQCGFMFYGELGDVCEWTLCAPCARGEQWPRECAEKRRAAADEADGAASPGQDERAGRAGVG